MNGRALLRLIRPYQWIKNFFVAAPFFFSFNWTVPSLTKTLLMIMAFSLASGGIYALNDVLDVEEDRRHPKKCKRPVAVGEVRPKEALFLAAILCLLALLVSFIPGPRPGIVLGLYIGLNVIYSLSLKHISPLDVFIIAINFVLRVFAGSVAIEVPISKWMILSVFSLALFLGFAKRRHEFFYYHLNGNRIRRNLDGYNLEFAAAAMLFSAVFATVSYVMYSVSPEVQARLNAPHLYLTSLPVVLGILRYLQITLVENGSGDPSEVVLKDRFLQATVALWLISFYLAVRMSCIG